MAKATFGTGSSVMMNVGGDAPISRNGLSVSVGFGFQGQTCYVLEGNVTSSGDTLCWLRDEAHMVEDVATGSAAGPVGAYLYRHGRFAPHEPITLRQGRFVGRDSEIGICKDAATGNMLVSGEVRILVRGTLAQMP